MKVAITGAAGFIAFHVAQALLEAGHAVSGMDSFVGHDPGLARDPDVVLHLAGEAGARTSFMDPDAYVRANIIGTRNLLEACRMLTPAHLLIASSSSVYGANELSPSAESDRTDFPVSFYNATKSSVELMSHAFSHAFDIPTTCLRFFTVHGPWGRPDMALFTFVRLILAGEPIDVYGDGELMRDFTYVAGSQPVLVTELIDAVEVSLDTVAVKTLLPRQQGDVVDTHADASLLTLLTGLKLQPTVREGVADFVEWYREHYRVCAAKAVQ